MDYYCKLVIKGDPISITNNGISPIRAFKKVYSSDNDKLYLSSRPGDTVFNLRDNSLRVFGEQNTQASFTFDIRHDRALVIGGYYGYITGIIWADSCECVQMTYLSDALLFGQLLKYGWQMCSSSNGSYSRGISGCGSHTGAVDSKELQFHQMLTPSTSIYFGSLQSRTIQSCSDSNGILNRAIFAGGTGGVNTIDYVQIDSPSNSSIFGNLTANTSTGGAISNKTGNRCIITGDRSPTNTVDIIQISSPANSTLFGTLQKCWSSCPHGLCNPNINKIILISIGQDIFEKFDIMNLSTSSFFGNLITASWGSADGNGSYDECLLFGTTNSSGGSSGITHSASIDKINISVFYGAVFFGNLSCGRWYSTAISNA